MTFEDYWNGKTRIFIHEKIAECAKANAQVTWHDAYSAGLERAAEIATRKAGHISYPLECCQEDYEDHLIALDIAAAIRAEIK